MYKTRITALFDDKATFIDTSKTPIFEWEVAILFIHLWVDKVVLVSVLLATVTRRYMLSRRLFRNIISVHFNLSLSLNTRITALFDDKATLIDRCKTPIFEWEAAILFIHLWVDKVMLVWVIFQMLQQSLGDK